MIRYAIQTAESDADGLIPMHSAMPTKRVDGEKKKPGSSAITKKPVGVSEWLPDSLVRGGRFAQFVRHHDGLTIAGGGRVIETRLAAGALDGW